MSDSSKSATQSRTNGETEGVGDLVGHLVRNAAGEVVKGGSSLAETTRRVVADAVDTLDERGPDIAKNAGILTWRYALLGWATWNVGKFVVKRRTRKTVKKARRKVSSVRG
jgi:hypothetical protein